MQVRRADLADAGPIAEIEAAAAHHPWSALQVRSALQAPGACAWIATLDDTPVGHLVGQVVLDEAELGSVAVHPSARRRGVAVALLQAAYAGWSEAGAQNAFLEVRVDNVGAVALYARDGWSEVGRRRRYYADGCDALLMRKPLAR